MYVSSFSLLPGNYHSYYSCFAGSYPASPNTSASFLWLGGSFFGVVYTIIIDQLRDEHGTPPNNMKRGLLFQGLVALFFCSTIIFFNSPYLRREAEETARNEKGERNEPA